MRALSPDPPYQIRRPLMFQDWTHLTFVHWRYDPARIRPLLPAPLQLDTFDNAAWIGLTPFFLRNLRPPLIPAVPWLSSFPETNVRTYVIGPDGEPGICFFTLEADRLAAVIGARLTYGLPYRWSRMRVTPMPDGVEYTSRRHPPFKPAQCTLSVRVGNPIIAGELELFLTARFRLYTFIGGRLAYAQVDHAPWQLQAVAIERLDQDLVSSLGIPAPATDPIAHHSRSIHVRVGRPHLVRIKAVSR